MNTWLSPAGEWEPDAAVWPWNLIVAIWTPNKWETNVIALKAAFQLDPDMMKDAQTLD